MFTKKDPAQIAKHTVNECLNDAHVLPYSWTMFFHSRKNRVPVKVEEQGESENGVATVATGAISGAAGSAGVSGSTATQSQQTTPSVDSFLQTITEMNFPEVYTKDTYNGMQKTCVNIATVEQLWQALSLIKVTSELPAGSEFFIFKSGVDPVWEDPINAKGGRWMFKFSRRYQAQSHHSHHSHHSHQYQQQNQDEKDLKQVRRRSALIWERLLLRVLGGSLIGEDNINGDLLLNDISGLVLSIRKEEEIISVWNTNLCFERKFQEQYFSNILKMNPLLKNSLNLDSSEELEPENKKRNGANSNLFNDRRVLCRAVLSIIREVDSIMKGSDVIDTKNSGSNERVHGVVFEYRLHSDNGDHKNDNHQNHHHNNHHNHHYKHNNRKYNNDNKHRNDNKEYEENTGTSAWDKLFEADTFNLKPVRHENYESPDQARNLMSIRKKLQNLHT